MNETRASLCHKMESYGSAYFRATVLLPTHQTTDNTGRAGSIRPCEMRTSRCSINWEAETKQKTALPCKQLERPTPQGAPVANCDGRRAPPASEIKCLLSHMKKGKKDGNKRRHKGLGKNAHPWEASPRGRVKVPYPPLHSWFLAAHSSCRRAFAA